MNSWQWIVIPLSALALTGCSSLFQSPHTFETLVDEQWDCTEVDENGEWDCEELEGGVSTDELVAVVNTTTDTQIAQTRVGPAPVVQTSIPRPRVPTEPVVTALASTSQQTVGATVHVPTKEEGELPDYLWLAYEPESEVQIQDLPDSFYVVQLAAFATKEKAIEYVTNQTKLRELRGVRVLANDKPYFNILLGIYEDKRRAERAAKSVENDLEDKTPWIRSMASLKTAMKAADAKFGEEY